MVSWSWRCNIVFVGLTALILSIGGYWYHERNKDVIAWVGDFSITKANFVKEMQYRGGESIQGLDKQALLDEMIAKKLILNKAYELGYHKRPDVQREFEHLLMGKVRSEFLAKKRSTLMVNEEDVKSYYKEHQDDYLIPQRDRFAVLFIKKRGGVVDKDTERLRAVQVMAEAGELPNDAGKGFGEHSVSHSEHQVSRYKGGDIGWFSKSEEVYWERDVLDAGFSLKQLGDISEIIETNKGYYLVRLMDREDAKYQSLDRISGQVRHKLILAGQRSIEEQFGKSLREDFAVSVRDEKFQQLNPSTKYAKDDKPIVPPSGMLN